MTKKKVKAMTQNPSWFQLENMINSPPLAPAPQLRLYCHREHKYVKNREFQKIWFVRQEILSSTVHMLYDQTTPII